VNSTIITNLRAFTEGLSWTLMGMNSVSNLLIYFKLMGVSTEMEHYF